MSESEVLDIEIPKNVKWQVLTLNDIKSPEKRSIISGPFGSNISSKYFTASGVPVIRGNNLSNTLGVKFKDGGFVFISPEKARELNSWAIKDDLLFTAAGTIGQVGMLTGKELYDKYTISNKQLRVRLDKNIINPYFAYYWFASPTIVDLILQRDTGSTIPLINLGVLRSLPILLPPLAEQEAIAEVLSSLDDKIDLLSQNNKTLESLAETLFRKWFVEEADDNWVVSSLRDVFDIGIGRTPPRNQQQWFTKNPNDIKWVSIKDMGSSGVYVTSTSEYLTQGAVKKFNIPVIPANTVILSFKMTIGRLAITTENMLSNEAIAHFKVKEGTGVFSEFIYLYLKTYKWEQLGSTSSIVEAINSQMIKDMEIAIPSREKLMYFKELVSTYFEKIHLNQIQIEHLENLRNELLPKLMSSAVRVNAFNPD